MQTDYKKGEKVRLIDSNLYHTATFIREVPHERGVKYLLEENGHRFEVWGFEIMKYKNERFITSSTGRKGEGNRGKLAFEKCSTWAESVVKGH